MDPHWKPVACAKQAAAGFLFSPVFPGYVKQRHNSEYDYPRYPYCLHSITSLYVTEQSLELPPCVSKPAQVFTALVFAAFTVSAHSARFARDFFQRRPPPMQYEIKYPTHIPAHADKIRYTRPSPMDIVMLMWSPPHPFVLHSCKNHQDAQCIKGLASIRLDRRKTSNTCNPYI